MMTNPPPSSDGEGVYPHSYERLGVQHGLRMSPPSCSIRPAYHGGRDVTLQAICGPKLGHVTPPHKTKYVKPGQTKSVTATCPGRRHLFGGGFQRTDFVAQGGNFVTESRAISPKSWRVVGHAFGAFGGELTAIAYCVSSGRPRLAEVSSSTVLGTGSTGTATTPGCPPGRRLTAGGFSSNGSESVFFTNGMINARWDLVWLGLQHRGGDDLTAYGYCLKL